MRGIEAFLRDDCVYSIGEFVLSFDESKMRGIDPPLRVLCAGGASEYGGSGSPILCCVVFNLLDPFRLL